MKRSYFAATAGLVFAVVSQNAFGAAGSVWEVTTQNVMEGMPMQMPAQTSKVCSANDMSHPPASAHPGCTNSDFQRSGNTATWTVTCTGQMAMTGKGEMTFEGSDAYTGSIKFASQQMNMTVKLAGHKTAESCTTPQ
jgi:hypothetical protein